MGSRGPATSLVGTWVSTRARQCGACVPGGGGTQTPQGLTDVMLSERKGWQSQNRQHTLGHNSMALGLPLVSE